MSHRGGGDSLQQQLNPRSAAATSTSESSRYDHNNNNTPPPVPVRTSSLTAAHVSIPLSIEKQQLLKQHRMGHSKDTDAIPFVRKGKKGDKRRQSDYRVDQDQDYIKSLLELQQRSLDDTERKIDEMRHMNEQLRAKVITREKKLYTSLLPDSHPDQQLIGDLILRRDEDRKLKSEIIHLISEISSLGYEGPLGHVPQNSKSDEDEDDAYESAKTTTSLPPKLPPRQKQQTGFGLLYGRVPPAPRATGLRFQGLINRSVSRPEGSSPPALPSTPSPAARKRNLSGGTFV